MPRKVISYELGGEYSGTKCKFYDQSDLTIKPGDYVTIVAQGTRVTGTVVSASHYGREGWFIELTDATNNLGYAYWKQYLDGGYVTKINGKAVEM